MDPDPLASAETITLMLFGCRRHKSNYWTLRECLSDEEQRRIARERAASAREREDQRYIEQFASAIQASYPACPGVEALAIARHACEKHSGRVGRSAAAKAF